MPLLEALRRSGISRQQLADHLLVSSETINNWIYRRANMRGEILVSAARLLLSRGADQRLVHDLVHDQLRRQGYDPDALGELLQPLGLGEDPTSKEILIVGAQFDMGHISQLVEGVHGATIDIAPFGIRVAPDWRSPQIRMAILDGMRISQLAAVVVSTPDYGDSELHRVYAQLLGCGVPTVFCFDPDLPGASYAYWDDEQMGEISVRLLADHGHQSVGYVGLIDSLTMERRHRGFVDAVRRYELDDAEDIICAPRGRTDSGPHSWSTALHLLETEVRAVLQRPGLTAIVASSELAIRAVMSGAHSLGRRWPDDLSIIYLGSSPWMDWALDPPLTRVAPDSHDLGFTVGKCANSVLATGVQITRQVRVHVWNDTGGSIGPPKV
jgi:DNA-binding LacI/PurR family transcriptional regulator